MATCIHLYPRVEHCLELVSVYMLMDTSCSSGILVSRCKRGLTVYRLRVCTVRAQSRLTQLNLFAGDTVKLMSRRRWTLGYIDVDEELHQDDRVRMTRLMRINLRVKLGDVVRCALYSSSHTQQVKPRSHRARRRASTRFGARQREKSN